MRMFYRAGLILCLGAVLVSAETGCPYQEDVYPCVCEEFYGGRWTELMCHHVHDTQALVRVFENSRRYSFFEILLNASTLQYIPHQIFDDVKVDRFLMFNVTLRTLFDGVPRDPGIDYFHADGVKILGGFDWEKLAVFKRLEFLLLFDISMKKLSAGSFSGVSKNLQQFCCHRCKIKQLEEYLFKDFSRMRDLNLQQNAIAVIKRNMFPGSNLLSAINMEYNKISTLPSDIFSDMPRLKQVKLAGNLMTVLPEETFRSVLVSIEVIDVRENPVKCDCLIAWVLKEPRFKVKGNCNAPNAIRGKSFGQLTRRDIRCEISSNSIL